MPTTTPSGPTRATTPGLPFPGLGAEPQGLDPLAPVEEVAPGPGLDGPVAAVEGLGALPEVQPSLLLGKGRGVGGLPFLGPGGELREALQHLKKELHPLVPEPVPQGHGVLVRQDGRPPDGVEGAGVQALVQAHDGDPGLPFPGEEGPLDGGRPRYLGRRRGGG